MMKEKCKMIVPELSCILYLVSSILCQDAHTVPGTYYQEIDWMMIIRGIRLVEQRHKHPKIIYIDMNTPSFNTRY